MTEDVHGSGSGRTNAQDFTVAGGGDLSCGLICISSLWCMFPTRFSVHPQTHMCSSGLSSRRVPIPVSL